MLKVSNLTKPIKIRVSSGNSQTEINSIGNSSEYYSNLSKAWAVSDEMVQDIDYSSKYYAQQAKSNADSSFENLTLLAEESARQIQIIDNKRNELLQQANQILAQSQENVRISSSLNELIQQNIQEGITGLAWKSFESTDWVLNNNIYQMELDVPVALCVYTSNKLMVTNIDVQNVEEKVILTSINAFDGYVITAKNDVEDEDNNELTDEELEELTISSWDDI